MMSEYSRFWKPAAPVTTGAVNPPQNAAPVAVLVNVPEWCEAFALTAGDRCVECEGAGNEGCHLERVRERDGILECPCCGWRCEE